MLDEHLDDIDEEMYSGDEEYRELDETESVTPSINFVRNQPPIEERGNVRERDNSQLLRVIPDALQRVTGIVPTTSSTPPVRKALIKELLSLL
ncbi:hypothetical protein J1N35_033667 [Gossypium stocksii]|uniref:Uncharacterized protein n=1 Tax=Gossypium stocksii TaxID=47602 RepID=A0A9D3UQM5_9ROSI|nr:hypothetical protein J1N35_033667 [Gossypium stocksii]